MLYNQPLDQPTNSNAGYVDGNPAAGIQGSIVPAASIEFDQREIVEVITRANVRGYTDFSGTPCGVPSNSDLTQLRKAIEGYIESWVIDTTVTFTVHGTGANFPDLITAMTYLSKYRITNNGFVTLAVAGTISGVAARWTYSQTIVFSHPNLDRICVLGAPMIGPPVQGSDFQYTNNLAADAAAQLTMLRGRFASEIHFTNGAGILVLGSMNVSRTPATVPIAAFGFQNLLFSGDGSSGTNLTFNNACMSIANCSIQNLNYGVICNNCYIWCSLDFCSACGNGIYGWEFQGCMAYSATQVIACSNQNSGFTLQAGTSIKTGTIYCKGNGASGLSVSTGSACNLNAASQFISNKNYGIQCSQSMVNVGAAGFSGNTPGSIYCWGGAGVYAGGAVLTNCTPAPNTQGNFYSWIAN
jgi:hypothetical protein